MDACKECVDKEDRGAPTVNETAAAIMKTSSPEPSGTVQPNQPMEIDQSLAK